MKTLENLTKAFVGESQARNRYTRYASIAKKEWYLQIAEVFLETAEQEKEHAERFFKMIQILKETKWLDVAGIDVPTTMMSTLGDTLTNLQTSAAGELEEYSDLYPHFAQAAEDEWFPEFATRIRAIMNAEMHHEERFKRLHAELSAKTLRNKEDEVERVCTKCWYTHIGNTPPEVCPSCGHDETYYVVKCELY